jgi:molybdopterin converting factor small subunit
MDEEKMKKIVGELMENSEMSQSIYIKVRYDKELQKITGTEEEPVCMSQGSTFMYLLQNVFMSHPDIEKRYPPGSLGFVINDIPPKIYTPLLDGDVVSFTIMVGTHN